MRAEMKIETPCLIRGFHDSNWQPDQQYWSGHTLSVPVPYQATPPPGPHLGTVPASVLCCKASR